MQNVIQKLNSRMDNSRILQCVRSGLVMMLPVLLIGSLTLVLRSLPIPAYQQFMATFLSGIVDQFLTYIYDATFGFLAVYMTAAISISYARLYIPGHTSGYGSLFTSLSCFFVFSGVFSGSFTLGALGSDGMLTAMICAISASALYGQVVKKVRHSTRFYADGADGEFRNAMGAVVPSLIVMTVFALFNLFVARIFQEGGVQGTFNSFLNLLFHNMGRSVWTALLYVFLSSLLWFFGVHGEDVLDPVLRQFFGPGLNTNIQLYQLGEKPTEIFCKPFFDVFVVMGGCGTTICLLIAILLFGRRRSDRKLVRFAALPMIFNINEILVLGLPVVFNPILFIPFIATPLIMTLTTSLAMYLGIVPMPVASVEWTTPVLVSGYLATGSAAGAILQALNILIGVVIYRPFILMNDSGHQKNARRRMEELVQRYIWSETECRPLSLLSLRDTLGGVSKSLAEDLAYRLEHELPTVYYQPQYHDNGTCIGVEALLRWEHPLYGMVYPPMVIKLADEMGQLMHLEKAIYKSVIQDMDRLLAVLGDEVKISVNVSGLTIQTLEFEEFLGELHRENPKACRHICIEITEQTALQINDALIERLERIHNMGYMLAIDDFSMGSTSIKYLQSSVFDLVKLDGSLSRDIVDNVRSREIVASIAGLSNSFGIHILAEYVETEDQRKLLKDAGCSLYQGYLYSSAVPIDRLENVRNREAEKQEEVL